MRRNDRPVALVTGAARGIGRACAEALAARGFDLVLNDLDETGPLRECARSVRSTGAEVCLLPGDIAEVDGHVSLVEAAWAAFRGIDCLVNNAGVSVEQRDDILKVTTRSFDRLVGVNLRGTFFLTQEVARRMLDDEAAGFRSIVTISSANSEAASPDRAEYCLAKTALSMMTNLFALRLADAGINVYEIRPGVIRTEMTAVARDRYERRFAEGLAPINRWGEPRDVGTSVAALAAGAFPYSTGQAIRVDGGMLISRF